MADHMRRKAMMQRVEKARIGNDEDFKQQPEGTSDVAQLSALDGLLW
jgi:hypothetical protein